MKNIAIIILSWNNKDLTDNCIKSINAQKYSDYQIFVVDNNSSDGAVSYLKDRHKDVEFIQNSSNLGYAAGINIGIRAALKKGYKYIYILNNDVELAPNSLAPMIKLLETATDIGVVSAKSLYCLNGDKKQTKECTYFGDYNFLKGEFVHYKLEKDKPTKVKIAIGCALLFKSEVFKNCGLLDERYYIYFEENDLLTRITNYGYSIFVHPKALVYHRLGSSTGSSNFPLSYYSLRNQLLFHKKHSPKMILLFFAVYFTVKLPFFLLRKKNFRDLRLNLLTIKDFLLGCFYRSDIVRRPGRFLY